MRETLHQQARSWHARPGSSRSLPVRRDPIVNGDWQGPGGTGDSLLRAGLRLRGRQILLALAALLSISLVATPAVAQTPSGQWVGLAVGRMGNVQWSVKVARPAGSAQRPCLLVGTKRERGRFDYERSKYQGCVERSDRLAATEAPLIVTGAQASPASG